MRSEQHSTNSHKACRLIKASPAFLSSLSCVYAKLGHPTETLCSPSKYKNVVNLPKKDSSFDEACGTITFVKDSLQT